MKLGKALAIGVAEERPQIHDRELELPQEAGEFAEVAEITAPEEVPATR
ncbi:hypothetical protein N7U49_12550 [Streptomyces sp. AD2-2]|nr:hypothetical protein N7U49_12550 [Streptomyces sp. AD2-2]